MQEKPPKRVLSQVSKHTKNSNNPVLNKVKSQALIPLVGSFPEDDEPKPCYTNSLASAESKLASKPGWSKYKHNTQGSPINTNILIRMKVSVTSTMFTNLTCKLSKCVCEFGQNALNFLSISRMCKWQNSLTQHTAWVYIPIHSRSARRIRLMVRRIIFRIQCFRKIRKDLEGSSFEDHQSKHIFRGDRRIYIILRSLILRARQMTTTN